ncbi:MAG: hypothetical protein KJN68_04010, partial [Bacteroidia bacterium]|nr:hypothetical protein [Bacteroidia bacterium]
MKDVLHKIMSVFMALVVVLSTMSFAVGMHFCGETLVDTALFQKADSCGMELMMKASDSECSVMKINCCTDEQVLIEGQDELKLSFNDLDLEQQFFVTSFYLSYVDLFEGLEEQIIP